MPGIVLLPDCFLLPSPYMPDNPAEPQYSGEFLLIDKPLRWTSFDVVKKLRYALARKWKVKRMKVGHAGTLDPLATGLLIICTGKKTKEIPALITLSKTYSGTITLGAITPTYDLESEPCNFKPTLHLSKQDIITAAKGFVGRTHQKPPDFSAKKVGGKKSYNLARKGLSHDLKTVQIEIFEFEILSIETSQVIQNGLDLRFRLQCSKGTYVRSLAFDLGAQLGCGGFLSSLRRECVGEYSLADAQQIEEVLLRWEAH